MEDLEFADVYRRHITMVRGRAQRLLGHEAEDLAQEAFIRFLEYRRAGKREEKTSALLYKVVTNLALNRLRDTQRRAELLERSNPEPVPALPQDDRLALRQALGRVDPEQAEIAAYYYVDGLEQQEIAQLLGLQRRTVGRRLERFCQSARKLLTQVA